jgi:hypothetical protein
MRRVLVALVCVVVGFAVYASLARWVLHGPVTPHSLAVSLDREAGSGGLEDVSPCRRTGAGAWTCDAHSEELSAAQRYELRMVPDGSCWRARRIDFSGPASDLPRVADDCVRLWQWSALDLLVG